MARLATLGEAAVVRIFMTIGTLVESDANILWLAVCAVDVTLGTLNLSVESGQWIACLRMIELTLARADADRLPVNEAVAGLAFRPQAALVLVFVTGYATGR